MCRMEQLEPALAVLKLGQFQYYPQDCAWARPCTDVPSPGTDLEIPSPTRPGYKRRKHRARAVDWSAFLRSFVIWA